MPKFYFHLHNDLDVRDPEGGDFADLDAAHVAAVYEARVLVAELIKEDARLVLHHRIDIEDAQGTVLNSVVFSDVVTVED